MKKLSIKKPQSLKKSVGKASRKTIGFKASIALTIIFSLCLFGASGVYWYANSFTNPERVMSDVLNKSLQTTSVNRTVVQDNGQNSVNQTVYVAFTPTVAAKSSTDLSELSEQGQTDVTTETIGTKTDDYVRYTSINVQGTAAPKRNFDSVLNVWGKKAGDPQNGNPSSFLNDALFVVVPFGNLNADQRSQLTKTIRDANLYGSTGSKTEFKSGRPIMTLDIQLDPETLVTVLSQYVKLTGVGSSEGLDPAQYKGAARIPIKIEVDLLSRHINTINFVSSGRVEKYHGYNTRSDVNIPNKTVDVNELQSRLQALEGQK